MIIKENVDLDQALPIKFIIYEYQGGGESNFKLIFKAESCEWRE